MERVLFCWSGGKDSAMALFETQKARQYEVVSLLTTITEGYDRVSLHEVRRSLVEQQAQSLGLPLEKIFISQDCPNQEYETKMRDTLTRFKQLGVNLVAFGDVFLEDVRRYREDNLSRLNLKGLFPLWGRDSIELTRSFIALGFHAITTCVDAKVMGQSFVGRTVDSDFLAELPASVDPAGENGEFHSFVSDGPIFRERIPYELGNKVLRDSLYFCDLLPADKSTEEGEANKQRY